MIKKIAKVALILTFIIFTASAVSAQTQTDTNCNTSPDYGAGRTTNCTSTTTPTGPTAAQVEQQKQLNQSAANFGAALGALAARKRAQHQQEKSDLTAVVFCRQNPNGNWTFPNKAPMPCATFEKNVIAYCTVNAKTPICKDVAKLGPAPVSAQAAVAAPIAAAAPQVQPQPPADQEKLDTIYCRMHTADEISMTSERTQAVCKAIAAQPGTQPVTAAQPAPVSRPVTAPPPQPETQPQQAPSVAQPATTAPEISVAEAARQAKIAKAIKEAREKAERDNPPPPQQ